MSKGPGGDTMQDFDIADFDSEAEFAALIADLFAEDYRTETDGWARY